MNAVQALATSAEAALWAWKRVVVWSSVSSMLQLAGTSAACVRSLWKPQTTMMAE